MNAVSSDREGFLADFLRAARHEVPTDLARWQATLEQLDTADGPGDGAEAYAEAVVTYRNRHYRYRRLIWPPAHPAPAQAGLYATTLLERLLTAAATAGPDTSEVTL